MRLLLIASHLHYLIKYLVVFMAVVHTYFYIVVDTQQGCRTSKSGEVDCKYINWIKVDQDFV